MREGLFRWASEMTKILRPQGGLRMTGEEFELAWRDSFRLGRESKWRTGGRIHRLAQSGALRFSGDPVNLGWVALPEQWPWSSFRFYHLNDPPVLGVDRLA
jgi:hypothetical protein